MDKENLTSVLKKEWKTPYSEKLMRIIGTFSLTEKVIFFVFVIIFVVSALSLLWQVNKSFLVEVPDYGGELSEGVIGSPRFVNPLLAISDTDKDISNLIYSGLLKTDSSGELVPDLAESYTISDDGLVYTFTLKDNLYFHDGESLTADDVIFTIEKAQNPDLKSPRKANWDGVLVQKVDDKTITFTLKQPFSPFIQNVTLGILPEHIWSAATIEEFPFSQFNLNPIGSGPYKIDSISYNSSGLPSEYRLEAFTKYALGKPYISNLTIKSYKNEKEILNNFKDGNIDSIHSISPKQLNEIKIEDKEIALAPLSRIFGVFFNQNVAPVFVYKEVRLALDTAADKQAIVDGVISGYGEPIHDPLPLKEIGEKNKESITYEERIANARKILTDKGWTLNENGVFQKKEKNKTTTLAFSISTGNATELKEAAYMLQKQWQDLGAQVEVKVFEIGDLNQEIIRPRKYDALLFGEVIGKDSDLYPFWHSSQRNAPGLNIALYTNLQADKILENIRKTSDISEQEKYFESLNKEIKNDLPAVFTYSPYFIYVVPDKVHNVKLSTLTTATERWNDINKWYIETNNVWKIFAKGN